VFAVRAPKRPNPIGISVVRLLNIRDNMLEIENLDIIDGTPLLDIKPCVPEFDYYEGVNIGWLEKHKDKIQHKSSDDRFQD